MGKFRVEHSGKKVCDLPKFALKIPVLLACIEIERLTRNRNRDSLNFSRIAKFQKRSTNNPVKKLSLEGSFDLGRVEEPLRRIFEVFT